MLPELKYLPVNWSDGMKISQNHFNQQENSITDRIRDGAAISINSFNYGLLLPIPGKSTLSLNAVKDQSGLLRIRLEECRAITGGGIRIELKTENPVGLNAFETTINPKAEEALYVVVAVNPFEKIPSGEPNPAEAPIRRPFTTSSCKLMTIPVSQAGQNFNSDNYLIIGRLKSLGAEFFLDLDYIPPSTSIQSHPKLLEEYQSLGNVLGQIGTFATAIVQKVRAEKQKTDLASNVLYLAEKIVFFLSDKIAFYRLAVSQLPPIYLVEVFLSFAYYLKSAFDCLTEKEREQMLSYFEQWIDLTPAQFQSRNTSVIELEYNHLDISKSLFEIKSFVSVILKLLNQLSKLKYIGDQPNSGIVIGEAVDLNKENNKTGWSFLND